MKVPCFVFFSFLWPGPVAGYSGFSLANPVKSLSQNRYWEIDVGEPLCLVR